jgi:ABC-type bacteriocin/lantibiotic exporter with double-glycine peptidase domain
MQHLSPIKRFWQLLKEDKKDLGRIYTYAVFHGLVNLSIPLGIQAIVNLIQGGQVSSSWIVLVTIVVAGVVFSGVLQLFQLRIIENMQQKLFVRSAFEFTFRMPKIRSEAIDQYNAPELMNRFFDTLSIQKGLSKILIDFSTATLQVVFGLLLLSFYHPFFILFSFALVILVYFIYVLTAKKGLDTSLNESKYKYRVAFWLQNLAQNKDTFKLAGATELHLQKTDTHVQGYLNFREKHFKVLRQQYTLLVVFKSLVAAGLLIIGGLLVLNQQMNIGQFIAAEIIILLVLNSVEKLILSVENIYDVLAALEKIGLVTDLETETNSGQSFALVHQAGNGIEVEIKNLQFSYPNSNALAISHFELLLKAGEKVCIVGENGSGKSTLLHLIAGLYQIRHGSISFNGLPIGNFNPEEMRAQMGIRFAEEQLFQGTLYDNISIGRADVQFDDVLWAIDKMQLSDYVKSLPKGLDTEIGAEGDKLSKSIVQKILLARSIANKPGLLLLENSIVFIEKTDREKIIDFLCSKAQHWSLITTSSDAYLRSSCMRMVEMKSTKTKNI